MMKVKLGWRKCRLIEICSEVSERVSNPSESEFERFVGLEHMETGETKLRRYGVTTDLVSAMKLFKTGDILVARRNVYLRRAACADFDGVCSGDAIVLRPTVNGLIANNLIQFVLNTDEFWDYAVKHASGTMSKRLSVDKLLNYEFLLPPIEEQTALVKVLSAAQEQRDALRAVYTAEKNLYYSTIDSLYTQEHQYPIAKLEDVTTKIVDGVHKTPKYVECGVPFLVVENLTRGRGIDFSNTRFVTEEDHREYYKRAKPEKGDVLVSKDGTLGIARLIETDTEFSIFVSLALLKPKPGVLDGAYLRYFFDCSDFRRRIGQKTSGTAIMHIHLHDFRRTEIPLPCYLKQIEISKKVVALEKAMATTTNRIDELHKLARHLRQKLSGA